MEALSNPGECPFCVMYDNLEHNAVNFLMGPSVAYMEDDVRMTTNASGFCKNHYEKLHAAGNRLGLALMLHTHFMEINKRLEKLYNEQTRHKNSFFSKEAAPLPKYLNTVKESCYICDMISNSYTRYLDTFFGLFSKEEEVQKKLAASKGCCLPHLEDIINLAPKKLSGQNLACFYEVLLTVQKANMDKIEADLDWFVKKFDYRNQKESWKDSKDAPERAMHRLTSLKSGNALNKGDENE